MKDLKNTLPYYQTIVVGGGIVGAGLFRDLSLHGVSTLLIDKKDFASQTSSKSSKMLHGGIRYLENGDFHLVWEALHEKNLWQKMAPHLCREKSFFLPIYNNSLRPLSLLKLGLCLYDALSGFQNKPHRLLSKNEVIKEIPGIKEQGLKGAGVYHDVFMDDIKLCLENIYDGLQNEDCEALNYVSLKDFTQLKDGYICQIVDEITGLKKEIKCRHLVFATGPFTDQLMHNLMGDQWHNHLLPSQGSHLWLKKDSLPVHSPMVLTPQDGRVIFLMPWDYSILVGTTEVKPHANFFDVVPTPQEIEYLLQGVNEYFPNANLNNSHILSSFAGIRPLVREGQSSLGKTAREHKVFRPSPNMHVILGGKYTTFRKMAQETAEVICHDCLQNYNTQGTIKKLRQESVFSAFSPLSSLSIEAVEEIILKERPKTWEDLLVRRIGIPGPKHWDHPVPLDQFFKKIKSPWGDFVSTNEKKDPT